MLAAIRRFNTAAEQTARLTKFCLQAPKYVEVEFANGSVFKLSAEFLRINSPAADGKIRSIGGEKSLFGLTYLSLYTAINIFDMGCDLRELIGTANTCHHND
ncbi:hypothetical protein MTR_1252s0010 [Medicago truncatula]|uniref:Uncharacterized protein n=1 Tax=Medicago truncatula TaxID=3880 RepID=A0A072TPA6_MEDTR|nr:hypothetical protein MTR_1252s0010 [Medicago truncatula]